MPFITSNLENFLNSNGTTTNQTSTQFTPVNSSTVPYESFVTNDVSTTNVDNTATSLVSNQFSPLFNAGSDYSSTNGMYVDISPGTGIEETNSDNSLTNQQSSQFSPIFNVGTSYSSIHGEFGDNSVGAGIQDSADAGSPGSLSTNITNPTFTNIWFPNASYSTTHGEFGDTNPGTGIEQTNIDNTATNQNDPAFTPQFSPANKFKDTHGEYVDNDDSVGAEQTNVDNTATNQNDPAFTPQFNIGNKYKDTHGEYVDINPGTGIEETNVDNTTAKVTDPAFTPQFTIANKYKDSNGEYVDTNPEAGIEEVNIDNSLTNVTDPAFTPIFNALSTYSSIEGEYTDITPETGLQELTAEFGSTLTNITAQRFSPFYNTANTYSPEGKSLEDYELHVFGIGTNSTIKRTVDRDSFSNLDIWGPNTINLYSQTNGDVKHKLYAGSREGAPDIAGLELRDMTNQHYSAESKYSDDVNIISGGDLGTSKLAQLAIDNENAVLKDQYTKWNLRNQNLASEALIDFSREPFILRGIQRTEDKPQEPQRYGDFLGDSAFASIAQSLGLGTLIDRFAQDVVRIVKLLPTPRGLKFAGKLLIPYLMNSSDGLAFVTSLGRDKFHTMSYVSIFGAARARGVFTGYTEKIHDFRKKMSGYRKGENSLVKDGFTDTTRNYLNTLQDDYGMGSQGARLFKKRKKDFLANLGLNDKINMLKPMRFAKDTLDSKMLQDVYDVSGGKNLVKMAISNVPVRENGYVREILVFRCAVTGLTDTFTPTWSTINYIGQPDQGAFYGGIGRTLAFNLKVYATTRQEMVPMWQRLNALTHYTMPTVGYNFMMTAPLMKLTIGDMYSQMPCYMTALTMTIPDNALWETNTGGLVDLPGGVIGAKGTNSDAIQDLHQLPREVDINMTVTVIGHEKPVKGSHSFGPRSSQAASGIAASEAQYSRDMFEQTPETYNYFDDQVSARLEQAKQEAAALKAKVEEAATVESPEPPGEKSGLESL